MDLWNRQPFNEVLGGKINVAEERKWVKLRPVCPSNLPDRGRGEEVHDGLLDAGVHCANPSLPLLVVLLQKPPGQQLPLNGLQFVLLQEGAIWSPSYYRQT